MHVSIEILKPKL